MRKNQLFKLSVALLFLWASALGLLAQGQRGIPVNPNVFRDRVQPHWFAQTNKFWYRVALPENGSEFILVDAAQGKRTPAFDHDRLAKAYSEQFKTNVTAKKLPFTNIKLSEDARSLLFPVGGGSAWRCDLDTYKLSEAPGESIDTSESAAFGGRGGRGRAGAPPRPNATVPSPDGKYEAFIRGDNLWLRDVEARKDVPLSYGGNPGNTYLRDVERDRAVGMRFDAPDPLPTTPEAYWSPDSKHLVAISTHPVPERRVYYVESSPTNQFQPKLHSYPYLKPGDDIPLQQPHLFDVESRKEIPVRDSLYQNPWELDEFRWSKDSSRFMFLFNQRGHQVMRIVSIDAQTGESRPIVDEHSDTFIDYSGMHYSMYLTNTDEIIWMSERDGWNHLYLYDAKTGQVKNQITKGEWIVRGVERVDVEKRQVLFRAGGVYSNQDPYYIHYCRVNFDGTGLTLLTEGDGVHSVQFSPDGKFLIDTYSRVNMAPVNELRRADDGKLVCKLEEADISALLATGWHPPEPFIAKGRDGTTDIYGIITRPRNFDPTKKYPVIENIYAGPQGSFVPKPFSAGTGTNLVDLGFVVVNIDGMGTANRSKKFHDVSFKNLVDAGFPDRILWIKAAAAKYPFMDLTRVGIYGTSAGGQNALAGILTHPEFYTACVADCGCHDNRMDKIWWNEQWMGWPVGPEYEKNSNLTYVNNLKGKLFLMVGEDDENVDPATTMQVVNALIKADKDFDLLVMPGRGHGVAGTPYGQRRLRDFFVRTLLQTEHPSAGGVTGSSE